MAECEFHVGDVVQIKSYDEILSEFCDEDGSINVPHGWAPDMEQLCGEVCTISRICNSLGKPYIHTEERIEYARGGYSDNYWYISTRLLKRVDQKADQSSDPVINSESWNEMLLL